jgi:hypothetical protein
MTSPVHDPAYAAALLKRADDLQFEAAQVVRNLGLRPLLTQPRLVRMNYRNETGTRSPGGNPDDQRHYFVSYYETEAGNEWKIDISLWLTEIERTQLAELDDLRRRLTDETRLAILWIKDVWHRLPT